MRRVKQICISLPVEMLAELDVRAEARGISRSSLVSLLLHDLLRGQSANQRREEVSDDGEA